MRARVRRRVTWIITLSALLPLLSVWVLVLYISYQAEEQSAQRQQVALTDLAAEDFRRFLFNTTIELQDVAENIARETDPQTITAQQLSTLGLFRSSFAEVAIYSAAGQRQVASSRFGDPTLPMSLTGAQLLADLSTRRVSFADPPSFTGTISRKLAPQEIPRFRVATQLLSSNNQVLFLVADVSMQRIWTSTTRIETAAEMRVLILTEQGDLISAAKIESLLEHPEMRGIPLLGSEATVATYKSVFGEEVLGVRTSIEPVDWILVVERPLEVIYGNVGRLAVSLLMIIFIATPIVIGVGWYVGRRIAGPIQTLYAGVTRFSENPNNFEPVLLDTHDELSSLAGAFNTMASGLNASQKRLANLNEELEAQVVGRTSELHNALAEVQAQNLAQERLLDTVRRLSMPSIPITKHMVVMPLVGEFSADRANDISTTLLLTIEQERAKIVILDITGVPVVDNIVARAILDAAQAARLLGAQVILAGIRPDMAETLVNLHINLGMIESAATLEQAFKRGMEYLRVNRLS